MKQKSKMPVDGKTFLANGRRFSDLVDVVSYAKQNSFIIADIIRDGIFTHIELKKADNT